MLAVASSTNTTFLGFNKVRLMFMSCFSPALKLSPFCYMIVSNPCLPFIEPYNPHSFNALFTYSSLNL